MFDDVRKTLWESLYEFDWLARFMTLFNFAKEADAKGSPDAKATMSSLLKIIL